MKRKRFLQIGIIALWLIFLGSLGYIYRKTTCPSGYIKVPGSSVFNTKDFCAMQYEAQKSENPTCNNTYCPLSKEDGTPWNFASVVDGQQACSALGSDYSLMNDNQWMTIANNIATTPINDIDSADGLQLAAGNNDKLRNVLKAPAQKIDTTSCSLDTPLSDSKNAQCSLRTEGYIGTQQNFNEAYQPGNPNKSQNRTFALSNGSVIWDFTGNLWEWVDHAFVKESKTGAGATFEDDADGLTGNGIIPASTIVHTKWIEYQEVANYGILPEAKPQQSNLTSANGIGKISLNPGWSWDDASNYTTPFKAVARGGAWGNNENAGIYALDLALGPSYQRNYTGFRCVKALP